MHTSKMPRKTCCNGEAWLKKGAWTAEEDKKLIAYIQEHGEGGWRDVPEKAGLRRCGKSCRLRWTNYLKPDIKRGEFSYEEEQIIIMLHASRGNKWSVIARHLPKRTDNEIKNYWNTHLKKRLIEEGIDPSTHKPFVSNHHQIPTSPENSNSQNALDLDEQSDPLSSPPPESAERSRPSSISSLLNKMATRVTSIKGILSASMEGTTPSSSTSASEINNNAQQDHQSSQFSSVTDEIDFFSQSSWYNEYLGKNIDFSELLEECGPDNDNSNNYMPYDHNQNHLTTTFEDIVSSTSVDDDKSTRKDDGWSDYLFNGLDYDYMCVQSSAGTVRDQHSFDLTISGDLSPAGH